MGGSGGLVLGEEVVCSTSGVWSDVGVWAGGVLPAAGDTVVVDGAELDVDVQVGDLAGISLRNGAKLRYLVTQEVEVPQTQVDHLSTVEVGDGSATVLVPTTDTGMVFSAVETASGVALSKLIVHTNATLSGMNNFKNVDCYIYGDWRWRRNGCSTVFGTAAAGETSYIGLTMASDLQIWYQCNLSVATPTKGGCVKAVRPIVFENYNANFSNGQDYGNKYFFGVNNPTNVPIEIIARNSNFRHGLNFGRAIAVHGGVTLTLDERSYLGNFPGGWLQFVGKKYDAWGNATQLYVHNSVEIKGRGRIVVKGGSILSSGRPGNRLTEGWVIAPDEEDYTCVIVSNDSYRVWGCAQTSNRKGRIRVDGICGYNLVRGEEGGYRPRPLEGFKAIEIAEGAELRCSISNQVARTLPIDTVVEGSGRITAIGAPGSDLAVVIKGGYTNSFTGELGVLRPAADARIFFDDGAYWSGAVMGSTVGVTNLTTAGEVSQFHLEGLTLDDDTFALQVQADHTSDCVEIGALGLSAAGGRLKLFGEGASTATVAPKVVLATLPQEQTGNLPLAFVEADKTMSLRRQDVGLADRFGVVPYAFGTMLIFQ